MTERNQSLDLLRGAAILLVLLAHCAQAATSVVPRLGSFALNYGERGVQLFFIVSGYTMMLTFGERDDLAAARSFYIRRLFRIVPLFWVAIVFYLLLTHGEGFKRWAPDGVSARDVLLTFGFLNWCSVTALNSVRAGRLEHCGGDAIFSAVSADVLFRQTTERCHFLLRCRRSALHYRAIRGATISDAATDRIAAGEPGLSG
jgi:hypothetical protein